MNNEDVVYMRLAIEEAKKGTGRTSPNPCVGAIIVREGTIVGRGFHRKAGTPHAEIHAIQDAGADTAGATLYVTLEPCNHTGRTPPCTKAILEAGLSRVVVGMLDPNPSVTGGGCQYLTSHGVEVDNGLLEECKAINRPFIKHSMTGLPWIVMKAGMSLDGKISYAKGQGGRITGEQSRQFTHKLRNSLDAILVGIDTVLIDNPSLTTRLSEEDTRDPLRIILDTHLRMDPISVVLQQESNAQTWIYCGPEHSVEKRSVLENTGASVYPVELASDGKLDLNVVFKHIGAAGITSVLVEGGATVHGSILDQHLVDEVFLFAAPLVIGEQGIPLVSGYTGIENPFRLKELDCQILGNDILLHGLLN